MHHNGGHALPRAAQQRTQPRRHLIEARGGETLLDEQGQRGRRELGSAVLSRYQNSKTNQMEFFARTETTIGLVHLLTATAESAVQDAEKW